MGIFGNRSKTKRRPAYTVPSELRGIDTTPRCVVGTCQFVYDGDGKPANTLSDMFRKDHEELSSRADLAAKKLSEMNLMGIRLNVIVLLDGSGSMGDEYAKPAAGLNKESPVEKLLSRVLGFSFMVDPDKKIPVIVYGTHAAEPVEINETNYQNAMAALNPRFGSTNMADAFRKALALAKTYSGPTMIINITDGGPNIQKASTDEVIETASHPVFVKNLAIKHYANAYLGVIDDLPSRIEILKDENGKPVLDNENNLVLFQNDVQARSRGDKIPGTDELVHGDGIRVIDNVDSQSVDPYNDSDEIFMAKMLEELGTWVEVAARVGVLTGVPGITQQFTLAA